MVTSSSSIIALDVGEKRIGVAVANIVARIPRPLITLDHTPEIIEKLLRLLDEQQAMAVVVGWPRSLAGNHTRQTRTTEAFVARLSARVTVPVHQQDEALTSVNAEQELQQKRGVYTKGDVDALAATYILEDFLRDHPEIKA
jgi:putative Holliday junction resolvase